ncbi:MAG: hypothetical protein GTO18_22025 [Anaerolineales bacterium]|nr:hypothetical protein [Anaerolineales bacterium]
MSEEYEPIYAPEPPAPRPWNEIWLSAITSPSVETFEEIANDPNAKANRAFAWVFVSALVAYAIMMVLQFFVGGILGLSAFGMDEVMALFGASIIIMICCAPIGGALAVLGFAINTGLSQLIAGLLGGTGTYDKLAYAFGSITAPISLISSVLAPIPYLNCLGILLGFYVVVLNVIALKAVNQFDWGRAILTYVIIWVGAIFIVACIFIFFLALLGPAIGNVFSEIMQSY